MFYKDFFTALYSQIGKALLTFDDLNNRYKLKRFVRVSCLALPAHVYVVGLCTKPSICILKASEGDGFSFQCECAASLLRRPILASERGASRKRERERESERGGGSEFGNSKGAVRN